MSRRTLAVAIAFFSLVPGARAGLVFKKHKTKIDRVPVEVFVAAENGKPPLASWQALVAGAYPTPGKSVPVLADEAGVTTAANANFYREDVAPYQEPIGLVVHAGELYSLPNRFYPTAGLIRGKLEWDNVHFEGHLEARVGDKILKEPLCRLNAHAGQGCASLWLNLPGKSKPAKNSVRIEAPTPGLPLAKKTYDVLEEGTEAKRTWTIEFLKPELAKKVTKVTIDAQLAGVRLGPLWRLATEAVSGSHVLSPEQTYPTLNRSWVQARQPRTLVGVDAKGNAWLAVFDGRREDSRGVTVKDAWTFVHKKLGAAWAINLDGGGSTTLLHDGHLANKPADGAPRAVAVGWGASR